MNTNNFIYNSTDSNKTPIKPYTTANGYDIYIFQQNTKINIKFNNTVTGQLIIVGPGGNGNNANNSNAGRGGIGSAYIYDPSVTFYGENYEYTIEIPNGTIPNSEGDKNYYTKTFIRCIDIMEYAIKAYSNPQRSNGYKNNVKVSDYQSGGDISNEKNICKAGAPGTYNPIKINPLTFWLGGGGAGGNNYKFFFGEYGCGGNAGTGLGGSSCNNVVSGKNAYYMSDGDNIYAGNGGGGCGKFTLNNNPRTFGNGSPGIIVIVIPTTSPTIPTFGSRGYKQYLANNKNIMGKILNVNNNYFVEDNLNYPGNDINFNKGMNQTDCASKCDNDVNCVGFAINPDGCWTKKALKNQVYTDNLKTYIKSNTKPISSNSNLRQLNFSCPTVDGVNCYDDVSKFDKPPIQINQLSCNTTFDPNNIAKTLKFNSGPNFINPDTCENIFNNYNLFPTNNPLAVISTDVNTSINNIITNSTELSNLATQYQNSFKNINSDTDVINNINKILQQAPLKIACCNRNKNVNTETLSPAIKVPLTPKVYKDNKILAELNYQNRSFTIPANSCPANLKPNSDDCNVFYATYCQNYYNYLKSKKLSDAEILKVIPDCGCYFPKTSAQQFYPQGTPSICYKDGCVQNSISYLDPSSQGQQCSLTVCQNILNTTIGSSTDSSIEITPTLENNCGQYGSITSNQNNKNSPNASSSSNASNASNISNASNESIPSEISPINFGMFSSDNYTTYIIVAIVIVLIFCCCSFLGK